jgi:hypothetical protein
VTKAQDPGATPDPHRIALGLGEEAHLRRPTRAERTALGLRPSDLLVEYRHPDREPDLLPAAGLVIQPRRYGVRLPDTRPERP